MRGIDIKKIDTLKQHRLYVSDVKLESVSIACHAIEIPKAVEAFTNQYPTTRIDRICVAEIFNPNYEIKEYKNIPIVKLEENFDKNNIAVFADFSNSNYADWKKLMDYINNEKQGCYYYYSDIFYETGTALYAPTIDVFYEVHKKELNKAFNLMKNKTSKNCFMQRLAAIMKGRCGYLEFNNEEEYFPNDPFPNIKEGDLVIDVGISSYHPELLKYSELVGKTGKVIGFEASPIEYEKIQKNFDYEKYDNVEIVNLGLWDSETTLKISDDIGGSSVVYDFLDRKHECKLVTLDSFVEKNNITRINYLKMDIEGAEPNALRGAVKTIKKFRPHLAICVYHEPAHLYSLINFIHSLDLYYDFYMCHHSTYLVETVMYAIPKKINKLAMIRLTITKFLKSVKNSFNKLKESLAFTKMLYWLKLNKNKKFIIYGVGSYYKNLCDKNLFKNTNIVAVSDIMFEEKTTFQNYDAIPPSKIFEIDADYIFIGMKEPCIAKNYLKEILKENYKKRKFINL